MRRRDFVAVLGGAAAAVWSRAVRAQAQDRVWHLGYLSATETPGEPQAHSHRLIMEAALARLGYIEGSNLLIDNCNCFRRLVLFRSVVSSAACLPHIFPREPRRLPTLQQN